MWTSNCMLCRSINVCNSVLWPVWQLCDSAKHKHINNLIDLTHGRRTDGSKDDRGERGTRATTKPRCDDSGFQAAQMLVCHLHALMFSAFGGFEFIGIVAVICLVKVRKRTCLTYPSADGHRSKINTPTGATAQRFILECNCAIGKL